MLRTVAFLGENVSGMFSACSRDLWIEIGPLPTYTPVDADLEFVLAAMKCCHPVRRNAATWCNPILLLESKRSRRRTQRDGAAHARTKVPRVISTLAWIALRIRKTLRRFPLPILPTKLNFG